MKGIFTFLLLLLFFSSSSHPFPRRTRIINQRLVEITFTRPLACRAAATACQAVVDVAPDSVARKGGPQSASILHSLLSQSREPSQKPDEVSSQIPGAFLHSHELHKSLQLAFILFHAWV